jgi:acetyl esterase/lipase
MKKIITLFGILLVVGGLAYHFAALQIFDALVPKDESSIRWQTDMAYGPDARQKLDIYMPRQHNGPLPMVLFVHGGSWKEGNKNGYAFAGRALAAKGYMTLVINYRLHPKDRYPAFVEDVAMALRWAAENGQSLGGDPKRLFAMGHSAGAYNIAQAVLDENYSAGRPKLSGVITLAGPFDFLPLDSPITIEVFGKVPDLPATQPVNHARADAPPFLLLHGSADTTVFRAMPRHYRKLCKKWVLRRRSNSTKASLTLAFCSPSQNHSAKPRCWTTLFSLSKISLNNRPRLGVVVNHVRWIKSAHMV